MLWLNFKEFSRHMLRPDNSCSFEWQLIGFSWAVLKREANDWCIKPEVGFVDFNV